MVRKSSSSPSKLRRPSRARFSEPNEVQEAKNPSFFRILYNEPADTEEQVDVDITTDDTAEEPSFPYLIFIFAITKDILDSLDVLLVTWLVTKMISLIFLIILMAWVAGKLGGGWWKKKLIAWLWKRYILVFVIEMVPIFAIVPASTIFIYMAHNREKKLVILFNNALEEMRSAGIMKVIRQSR